MIMKQSHSLRINIIVVTYASFIDDAGTLNVEFSLVIEKGGQKHFSNTFSNFC